MRPFFLAVPLSFLLIAPSAGAQSRDYPLVSDTSQVSTVHVTAPFHAYHVSRSETNAVKGNYAMSNGWYLNVRPAPNGIVARIDDERPMQLVAISANKYSTPDGNVAMEFNQGSFGDDMTMSYVPTSRVAAVIVIGSSVALR